MIIAVAASSSGGIAGDGGGSDEVSVRRSDGHVSFGDKARGRAAYHRIKPLVQTRQHATMVDRRFVQRSWLEHPSARDYRFRVHFRVRIAIAAATAWRRLALNGGGQERVRSWRTKKEASDCICSIGAREPQMLDVDLACKSIFIFPIALGLLKICCSEFGNKVSWPSRAESTDDTRSFPKTFKI